MKIANRIVCVLLLAALSPSGVWAASLLLVPSTAFVGPGDSISLNVVVSGLTDMGPPSLGGFDLDIGFDPAALSLNGFILGSGLGDIVLGEALNLSFGEYSPGVVNVAQVSLLGPVLLDAGQSDSLVLATLDMTVLSLAAGATTMVDFVSVYGLTDTLGSVVSVDSTSAAILTGVSVPLPAGLWLLVGALAAVGGRRGMLRFHSWR